jgi:hypothetical protein
MNAKQVFLSMSLVIAITSTAHSETLCTAPLPSVGRFDCTAVNLGKRPLTVSTQLLDSLGANISGGTILDLRPGASTMEGARHPGLIRCFFSFSGPAQIVEAAAVAYDANDVPTLAVVARRCEHHDD